MCTGRLIQESIQLITLSLFPSSFHYISTCSVKPHPSGTIPVPNPLKLLLMKEQAFPYLSTTEKYVVSLGEVSPSLAGSSPTDMALGKL